MCQTLIAKGDTLYEHGKLPEAKQILTKAIEKYPDSAMAYYLRASVELRMHMEELAMQDYTKAIQLQLKPKYMAEAYEGIGDIYVSKKNYDAAIEMDNKSIAIFPGNWEVYSNRAGEKLSKGDYLSALADADTSIKIAPRQYTPYNIRGSIEFYYIHDTVAAMKDYSYCITNDSNNITPYYGRARVEIALKDYEGAIKDMDKAILKDINHSNVAYIYRGNAKEKIKDTLGAISDYSKAISLDTTFPVGYFDRGCLEEAMNKYSEAIADYSKAIKIYPAYIPYYLHRGVCLNLTGHKDQGCADLYKALSMGEVKASDLIVKYCK